MTDSAIWCYVVKTRAVIVLRTESTLTLEIPADPVFANIRPFLRWAGSKRKVIKHLLPFVPTRFDKYYEPFLGGGSLFFFLGPKRAEISDMSGMLIDTYLAVRNRPEEILDNLRPLKPNKTTYKQIKRAQPIDKADAASRIIFLNKACWNGLFRVNSAGEFNVPFGYPKSDFIIDEGNFRRCATQLRRREVSIRQQDFEEIEDRVCAGDFVFLDPPYVTSHNLNGFVDWNECLFSWKDQVRLAKMAKRLARRGANVLITNANHADVRELYEGFIYSSFVRSSTLASDKSRRVPTSEAIFLSGPAYATLRSKAVARGIRKNGRQGPVNSAERYLAKSR
ncbi:DNA adenine methylase [Dongia sp.]|uniref:DNA adenine methylase n=1 Tax=Dongia sp. TaxID=1977262 RepID=UPI0037511158